MPPLSTLLARRAALQRLAAAAASLCTAPRVLASSELLVVGTNFVRVYEKKEHGEIGGLGAEIVRRIAAQLGYTARFEIYPWARAQAMVAQGRADILVGPYRSAEREALMQFSERAFYQDHMIFMGRAGEGFSWDGDYASLRDKRIVIVNGWAYGAEFDRARARLQLSVADTVEIALRMLAAHRVDLLATNRRNTEPLLPALDLAGKVVISPRIIGTQNGYFAFPRGTEHEVLRIRFDQAFAALVERGELAALARQAGVGIP